MSAQDDARRLVEIETQRLKAAKIAAYIGALRAQQFDLDSDLRIWNEHAPEQFRRKP